MVDDAIIETVAEVKDVVGEAKSDVAEEITKTVETTGEDGAIAEVKVDDVVKEVDDSIDVIYEIVEGERRIVAAGLVPAGIRSQEIVWQMVEWGNG